MALPDRLNSLATAAIMTVGLRVADNDMQLGAAVILGGVALVEGGGRAAAGLYVRHVDPRRKILGQWIGIHAKSSRVCLFRIDFDLVRMELVLQGVVYGQSADPTSSWRSKKVIFGDSGRDIQYLHVGAYPEAENDVGASSASGCSSLFFEDSIGPFTRGWGYFFDGLVRSGSSTNALEQASLWKATITKFERITPELLASLNLPRRLDLRSPGNRDKLIAAYREKRTNRPSAARKTVKRPNARGPRGVDRSMGRPVTDAASSSFL